jgi:spermidine synthase
MVDQENNRAFAPPAQVIPVNMDLRFGLLLLCFFVSGFAALLYQTAWTREFAFLFGTSELAVVAVLASYMGGLALGAALAARFVGRLARPVLVYGLMELGIAVGALCVPVLIRGVQALYLALAGGLDAPPETMALTTALFHLFGSFVVLVPCTALMGATLPLLARYAVSEDAQVGPRIGVLYAVNTFGAIAGTLVAAFALLPELGLRQTVHVGIAGNAIVFLAAAALARSMAKLEPDNASAGLSDSRRFHWILPAMTISGAVSFVYEVLWTRLLGQVLGGSTAAFASMLSSFLLGIALGSAIASRFAKTREAAARGFAIAQLGTGVLAWLAFRAADYLPELVRAVGASPSAPASGAAAAGIVLLPVTLCIGATFPFGVRLLARNADEAAEVSGRVYAWNTVGSIVGAILAGFFLLPALGFENTALVGIVSSLSLAIATAWFMLPRRKILAGIATAGLALVFVIGLPTPYELLLHSAIAGTRIDGELFYLGVGRSATVTVIEQSRGWTLLTNGLPESGVEREKAPDLRFDETAWLSLLPVAARPETQEILIIGLGGARTLGATPSTVAAIDVIELEEEVVAANRAIPRLVNPLDDPRVSLRLGDARGALNLTDKRYGAIISQPSHPWTSGASHLYTREFFELAHSKLEPGGIFIQWIGQAFVDIELFGSLMASMTDVFPYVQVYRPVSGALVFMTSDRPLDLLESAPRALAAAPADFGRFGLHSPLDFVASWALDTDGVRALAKDRPLNTDDHNRLATTRLDPKETVANRLEFNKALIVHDPVDASGMDGVTGAHVARRMRWNGEPGRAEKLAVSLSGTDRLAARGWLAFDQSRLRIALNLFIRAFEQDGENAAARAGLIEMRSDRITLENAHGEAERVVLRANERMVASDWAGLRELDAGLALIRPDSPLFASAARARATWRIGLGGPETGWASIAIIDELLSRERTPLHYLLRATAGAKMGDPELAWAALLQVALSNPLPRHIAQRGLALARGLDATPESAPIIRRLELQAGVHGAAPPATQDPSPSQP